MVAVADAARLLVGAYERLIQFDPAVVVPGHGPVCRREELRRWLDYFAWLQGEVAGACAEGRQDGDILRRIAPPEDMRTWWRFLQWKHQDSLARVLHSVRRGWLKG